MNQDEFSTGEHSIPIFLLRHLHTVLQQTDEAYPEEQQNYHRCHKALGALLPETVNADTLTDALESRLSAELTYVSWLGFMMNLECFQFPVYKKMLELDYEELHQEFLFGRFPKIAQASGIIEAFLAELPEACREAAEGILDFFSYLETVGFKLAHYWGFQFANRFLPDVIPGYAADAFFSAKYRRMLGDDLGFAVE